MTNRFFIDPDVVPELTADSDMAEVAAAFNELRQSVVDVYQFIEPFRIESDGNITCGDTPILWVVMTNTSAATVTLYEDPKDGYETWITCAGGSLAIDGNGKTTVITSMNNVDDTVHLKYDEDNTKWRPV